MTNPHQLKPKPNKLESSKPIGLRLTSAEREEACELAESEGRSTSNFVRCVYLEGLLIYRDKAMSPTDKSHVQA